MEATNSSYNRDFIYTIPSKVFNDASLTLIDFKIYMIIRSFMDTTGEAWPSNNWLAEKCQIERRSAIRSLDRLVNKGYIKKITKNDKRYLVINYSNCPEELVTVESPPSDISVTPPSDPNVTLYSSNTSNTKSIKTCVHTSPKNDSLTLSDLQQDNPFSVPEQMLEDWITTRKKMRVPITKTAWARLNTELAKCVNFNVAPLDAFEEMVSSGWRSLKADWFGERQRQFKSKQITPKISMIDRIRGIA